MIRFEDYVWVKQKDLETFVQLKQMQTDMRVKKHGYKYRKTANVGNWTIFHTQKLCDKS